LFINVHEESFYVSRIIVCKLNGLIFKNQREKFRIKIWHDPLHFLCTHFARYFLYYWKIIEENKNDPSIDQNILSVVA